MENNEEKTTISIDKPFTTMINATFDALDAEIAEKKIRAAQQTKEESEKERKELEQKILSKQSDSSKEIGKSENAQVIKDAKDALDLAINAIQSVGGSLEDLATLPAKIASALNSVATIVQQIAVVPIAMVEDATQAGFLLEQRAAQSKNMLDTDWPSAEETQAAYDTPQDA